MDASASSPEGRGSSPITLMLNSFLTLMIEICFECDCHMFKVCAVTNITKLQSLELHLQLSMLPGDENYASILCSDLKHWLLGLRKKKKKSLVPGKEEFSALIERPVLPGCLQREVESWGVCGMCVRVCVEGGGDGNERSRNK